MPITTRHRRIQAPIDQVWRVLVDVPGQPRWMRDLSRIELEDEGPLRVGSRASGTVTMFGLSQTDPIEVTALDPPTRYAIRHLGAFTGWGEFRLWPVDGGAATHVRWQEELRPTPTVFPLMPRLARLPVFGRSVERLAWAAARCLDPLLGPMLEIVFRADLRRLGRLVEGAATLPAMTAPDPAGSPSGVAIDPVCGIEVDIATARHSSAYHGETYWFCGKGCRLDFEDDPEKYFDPDYVPSM